MGEYTLDFTE